MVDTMGDSFEATGHPADLLTNTHLSVGTVLDALDQLKQSWDEFTTVHVLAPLSLDPVISVERDERVTRVDMSAVLARLTSRRTGEPLVHDSGEVRDALRRWVNTLAPSDREATAHGVRLISWADTCASLVLDVTVPRGKTFTSWVPSATATSTVRLKVQGNATVRAREETDHVDCARDGTAVVWRHPDPRLSSVIFADPDPAARWETAPNLVCVYTPGFPVVGAPPTAALRLAEETMTDHHLLSFHGARQLTWKEPQPWSNR